MTGLCGGLTRSVKNAGKPNRWTIIKEKQAKPNAWVLN
jgi:hypothetical protein